MPDVRQSWPKLADPRPSVWLISDRFRLTLPQNSSKWTAFGPISQCRHWPGVDPKTQMFRHDIAQIWPEPGQIQPASANIAAMWSEIGPKSAQIGLDPGEVGEHRGNRFAATAARTRGHLGSSNLGASSRLSLELSSYRFQCRTPRQVRLGPCGRGSPPAQVRTGPGPPKQFRGKSPRRKHNFSSNSEP